MGEFNCVVIGDASVGKGGLVTCYAERWNGVRRFSTTPLLTNVKVETDNGHVKLHMLHIRIRNVCGSVQNLRDFFSDIDLCLMCYSVVDPISYQHIYSHWFKEFRQQYPHSPTLLVGTKVDLRTDSSCLGVLRWSNSAPLTSIDGRLLCADLGSLSYIECSAKTGQGVKDEFLEAARIVLYYRRPESNLDTDSGD